jgi:hypothetical protein
MHMYVYPSSFQSQHFVAYVEARTQLRGHSTDTRTYLSDEDRSVRTGNQGQSNLSNILPNVAITHKKFTTYVEYVQIPLERV